MLVAACSREAHTLYPPPAPVAAKASKRADIAKISFYTFHLHFFCFPSHVYTYTLHLLLFRCLWSKFCPRYVRTFLYSSSALVALVSFFDFAWRLQLTYFLSPHHQLCFRRNHFFQIYFQKHFWFLFCLVCFFSLKDFFCWFASFIYYAH